MGVAAGRAERGEGREGARRFKGEKTHALIVKGGRRHVGAIGGTEAMSKFLFRFDNSTSRGVSMPEIPPGGNAGNQYLSEGVDTVCDQHESIRRNS